MGRDPILFTLFEVQYSRKLKVPYLVQCHLKFRTQHLQVVKFRTQYLQVVKFQTQHLQVVKLLIFFFSRFGAHQLHFDVMHLLRLFESEEMELPLETITRIHNLPIVMEMQNAILLLACQPDGRNNRNDENNLLSNYYGGSSSSTISQVSIGNNLISYVGQLLLLLLLNNKLFYASKIYMWLFSQRKY